ncbi:MAG: methionyl-tRNA formyltransferase [bacterium]
MIINDTKKMSRLKIIFIGTPEFGAIILDKLIENGYKPVLVITAPDKPVGRKQTITPSPVKITAQKHKIKVGDRISNISEPVDLIIVAAYGKILPKNILEIPKYGCLNVHPSLLPKYRGPSPIQMAILNGDKETGVTIMKMDEKIDHGQIISNSKFLISNKFTYKELHDELAKLGAKLLSKTIPDWINGKIKPVPQDETKATYTKIIKKEDGMVGWKSPIDYIERQVRALNPWPGTYTLYNGKILKILKAEAAKGELIIKEVQLEGKKPMSFDAFQRGHQDFLGQLE